MITKQTYRPLFADLDWMNREFGRRNQNTFQLKGSSHQSKSPMNWEVTDDNITIKAELAGINPDELEISLENRKLTISGERKAPELDEGSSYLRRERRFGSFSRTLTLPYSVDVDGAKAAYSNGILMLELPRLESDKPRKIAVSAAS